MAIDGKSRLQTEHANEPRALPVPMRNTVPLSLLSPRPPPPLLWYSAGSTRVGPISKVGSSQTEIFQTAIGTILGQLSAISFHRRPFQDRARLRAEE